MSAPVAPAVPILPDDAARALLVGRLWDPATAGPRVVAVQEGEVFDLTGLAATVSELLELPGLAAAVRAALTEPRWSTTDVVTASLAQELDRPHFLAPVDLQVIKACGVTFVDSMIERVIEERCGGDASRALEMRELVGSALGGSIASIRPGSAEAAEAKKVLMAEGLWSQYLEVGIGPDPEVFTKAPVLSSVGLGAGIGIPSFSSWNNPEPELVLIATSKGAVVGATLGNDVNLRDVEGEDGYALEGRNSVARISRPFEELVAATFGDHHQYPDGFALFTGTLFAPTQDREVPGQGFTHRLGDLVTIRSSHLGALVNRVGAAEELPQWSYGLRALFGYLHDQRNVQEPAVSAN